ncbi:hypothetical protein ACFOEE_10470 [Pseudoalteromonas fenneropenaei]|uniref:Adhesin domain-containing protein n=1 Tax=Pseudoalteromonas fenneropenaei TaxID=1737459 RepID=A0ABV7CK94_9GAMM
MKTKLFALLITLGLSSVAFADDTRTITKTFSKKDSAELAIDVPVGSVDIDTYDGDSIEVTIVLSHKNDDSWFAKKINLDEFELESKQSSKALALTIDSDDIEQEWQVKVPASMALDLELGVGNVKVVDLANSAAIEVGVGKVRIDTSLDDFKSVKLDSGVGHTSINGFSVAMNEERNMVGSEVKYRGKGEHSIAVELGVGNIRLSH